MAGSRYPRRNRVLAMDCEAPVVASLWSDVSIWFVADESVHQSHTLLGPGSGNNLSAQQEWNASLKHNHGGSRGLDGRQPAQAGVGGFVCSTGKGSGRGFFM